MDTNQPTTQVRRDANRSSRSKRSWRAVAIGAAALLAFILTASAATLGGLGTTDLGAEDSFVGACDANGVTVDYTVSYNATSAQFEVGSVVIGDIDGNCAGQTLEVALRDAGNNLLASGSVNVSGATESVAVTGVSVAAVEGISVAIYS